MTRSEADGTSPDATWSLPAYWLTFMLLILAVLVVAGIALLVRMVGGQSGPPPWFLALWFSALGWNLYWWLFRVAYRAELVGGILHWRAPFRRGSVPVDAIDRVGRFFGTPNTCVLRASGHASVTVFTQLQSFTPMLAALNRLNPAVPPAQ